ncbi:MAG TPA: cytochrome c oxidase accessory protein CcoG [Mariprofundaceae bacterium]|nr:cytochrome c oxidase accessory protein CcoG [Mariprofundaceae bacterium]
MATQQENQQPIEELYVDAVHWHVNTGGETIHAKRMGGRFRTYKWYATILWLIYLLGPYARWDGKQAILLDIPHRQFHLFSITIWPQDIWMLSLVLILLAMTLFGVTAVAGRVWCGYFCFQTVWTDWFTWIEDRIEGNPIQRRKLDAAPWGMRKIRLKFTKHLLWLLIAAITGITFASYFTDAFGLWHDYLTLQAPLIAWVVVAVFVVFTYLFAGFMREQVCFWLCPYARIQSVMVDKDTILPTYDERRGEPRGKVKARGESAAGIGDCVDCRMCVGVCPTGVDIREGMQEGCITCGLCIDACDEVMEKIGRPKGLIRYMSHKEMDGAVLPPLYKRPRVIVYSTIFLLAFSGIAYGLTHIPPVEFAVLHERQPLFTQMSDGSIQNKYTIKALNKTTEAMTLQLTVEGIQGLRMESEEGSKVVLPAGKLIPFAVFLRADPAQLEGSDTPVRFVLQGEDGSRIYLTYKSAFMAPAH